jgi:hypothetical protein
VVVVVVVVVTMTDRSPNVQGTSSGADSRGGSRASVARVRANTAHPLLRPFSLAVMTLATFMVVFALMMARMTASTGRIPGTVNAALVAESGASAVTTRTSGAAATAATPVQATVSEGPSAATPAIVTRSSGAAGVGRVGDD